SEQGGFFAEHYPEHITFGCDDVFAVAKRAVKRGLKMLPIPENYYDDLAARFDLKPAFIAQIKELNICYDRSEHGEYLHFYTAPLGNTFFEVAQVRGGYTGFGWADEPIRLAAQYRALRDDVRGIPRLFRSNLHQFSHYIFHNPRIFTIMTDKTWLLGLVGHGTAKSRTPGMQEAEGLAQGIPTVYRVIDTAEEPASSWDLKDILDATRVLGFNGLNITHPHKQEVIPYLDEVDERAAKIGAVNTVVIRDGKFYGYNTDVTGFGRGLEQGLPDAKLDNVVQVGAGGAGNAVAHSLIAAGVKNLYVADLDPERAQKLAENVAASAIATAGSFTVTGVDMADVEGYITEADGVVNATPVGMAQLPGTAFDTSI